MNQTEAIKALAEWLAKYDVGPGYAAGFCKNDKAWAADKYLSMVQAHVAALLSAPDCPSTNEHLVTGAIQVTHATIAALAAGEKGETT